MPDRRIYYSDEARQYAEQRQMLQLLLAAAIGMAVGGAAALLFAPQSGDKIRRRLAHAIDEGYQRGREATDDAIGELEKEIPGLRERIDDLIKRANFG